MQSPEQSQLDGGVTNPVGDLAAVPQPRQSRRSARWIFGGATIALVLLLFAPQIVGWSPLRHELPRLRMPGFTGRIRVGRASLSWWGPTELWDLELDAPDGKPFYRVAKVIEVPGAWGAVFRREDPLQMRLEHPEVTLLLRADGSNVEDSLAPVLAHPRRSRRRKSIVAVDGLLNATDSTTGRVANWRNIALEAAVIPQGDNPNRLHFSAALADNPPAKPLVFDFTWFDASQGRAGTLGKWNASVQTTDLPLTALGPVLSRFASDLELSGTVSTRVHLVSASDGNFPAAGDWRLTTQNLEVTCPTRLGDERLVLDEAEFDGQFSREASLCRVEKLKLTTRIGSLEGDGTIPLEDFAPGVERSVQTESHLDANFKLHGDVDLVALAALLPKTLNLREGIELTEGRVSFEAGSRLADARLVWEGSVATSRVAARVAGGQVAWDEPLKFNFAIHRDQNRTQVDALELQSDIIHLTGRTSGDSLHLDANCDLEQVISRLGQFVDTDNHELRGNLRLAADLTRDADGLLAINAQGDAENLVIRRQVTQMLERRAGDVPGAMPAGEPLPPAPDRFGQSGRGPAPPPDRPLSRREVLAERRAERKAARQARRDVRRQDRELRRQADEIVLVPVQEWQTLWAEPHLKLTLHSRLERDLDAIELLHVGTESEGLTLRASGRLAELFGRCSIELNGEADYDLARLIERIRETVGPYLQIVGKDTRRFSIKGPLRVPPAATAVRPIVPLELAAQGVVSWQSGDVFGLATGAGSLDLTLAQAVVSMRPLDMAVSGGRLNLAGRLLLTGGPALVEIPAGPVVDSVVLTEEVCDSWLKFIAPIVAQSTRTEGRISLALDETRLPLADLPAGELNGRVLIEGHVLPGPLFDEVGRFVGGIIADIDGGPLRDWLGVDRPLIDIDRQEIEFEMRDRRIYHSPMDFTARGIVIRTQGSVGLDQTLDLVATIGISEEMLSRARFLERLQGRSLEIPIQGTLRKPRLARGAIGRLAEQLGQTILDGILDQRMQRLFENSP
jgi:hypothetical protein